MTNLPPAAAQLWSFGAEVSPQDQDSSLATLLWVLLPECEEGPARALPGLQPLGRPLPPVTASLSKCQSPVLTPTKPDYRVSPQAPRQVQAKPSGAHPELATGPGGERGRSRLLAGLRAAWASWEGPCPPYHQPSPSHGTGPYLLPTT